MKQHSLAWGSRPSERRGELRDEMEKVVPWADLVALVSPYLPEGKCGWPPFSPETMLHIHFMQQWFALGDPAIEEALHYMLVLRELAGLEGWDEQPPDESTNLRFRHALKKQKLAAQILQTVNDLLSAKGVMLKSGTVVDAAMIAAPSSTKNSSGERDPEMKQSQKGQQWYFGMKCHIGMDIERAWSTPCAAPAVRSTTSLRATAWCGTATESLTPTRATRGAGKRPDARDEVAWHIAMRPGKRKVLDPNDPVDRRVEQLDRGGHSGAGRTPAPGRQASIRPREGPLPRAGKDHGAAARAVCAG
jgi:IS5 family transposase